MNDFSYTQSSVNAISTYKNQYGLIASFALRIQKENPDWALLNCIAVAHDRTVQQATDHKFNDGEPPVAPPIAFLDFVQTVMNKVCGLARADMRGKRTEDFGNGIDFSSDITDQIGFSVDSTKIVGLVDDDFFCLNNLHHYIAQGMDYLTDIEPLHYHAESVKRDDDTWVKANIADSFDDAVTIINNKALAYAEEQAKLRQGESATIDFSARANVETDNGKTREKLAKAEAEFETITKERKSRKAKVEKQLNRMANNVARKSGASVGEVKAKLGALVDNAVTA